MSGRASIVFLWAVFVPVAFFLCVTPVQAAGEFSGANPGAAPPTSFTGDSVGDIINQALADYVGYCTDTWGGSIGTGESELVSGPTYNGVSGGNHSWNYSIACTRTNGNTVSTVGGTIIAAENSCPNGGDPGAGGECPQQCDGSITGTVFLRPIYSANDQGDICHESSQCKMSAVSETMLSSSAGLIEYAGTNEGCSSEPEVPIGPANELENCVSSGTDTFCTEPNLADENCGMLNGDYICLDSIPDGDCTFYGNGNMACSPQAGSPPAPDDGVTAGTPATPDSTIESNGDTINNYNNTTVNNSLGSTSGSQQGEQPSQQEIQLDFSEIIENEPAADSFNGDIDQQTSDTAAELDEVITGLSDTDQFGVDGTTIGDGIETGLALSSCSDYVATMPGGQSFSISCSQTAEMRDIFAWVLRLAFVFGIFHMLTTRPGSGK